MKNSRLSPTDPRMREAVAEFEEIIRRHYPSDTFDVSQGDDPPGVYLTATVDVEDTDEASALYTDRLVQLQIEEHLPLYVLPIQPLERVVAERRRPRRRTVGLMMAGGARVGSSPGE